MKIEFGTGSSFARLTNKKAYFLVNYAIEQGIRRFDTGVNYGNWKTQPLLGLSLSENIKKKREELILTSKAGTNSSGYFKNLKNFNAEYIENMINKSIKDLNCQYLDKFYLHGGNSELIESNGLLKKLNNLKRKGKIKKFGVCTHDLKLMKKISSGFYQEFSLLMIDYNLIQLDRASIFNECIKNNIKISCGNSLCQGLLLQSPLQTLVRSKSLFYFFRYFLRRDSRKYINPAAKARNYIKKNYPYYAKSIPLSVLVNNSFIDTIPIGMLSKDSILRNTEIAKKPVIEGITAKVSDWCLNNCQIID